MNKATIFDYVRMCKHFDDECQECPVFYKQTETGLSCEEFIRNCPDKANEIILNWCKEHPVETRQDRFLKMFPNAEQYNGIVSVCPRIVDSKFICRMSTGTCEDCYKKYWLAEVEE